jgi:hypothetical protein
MTMDELRAMIMTMDDLLSMAGGSAPRPIEETRPEAGKSEASMKGRRRRWARSSISRVSIAATA